MIANYHTHTWRCNHADGREEEYVERAIEGGLKILGFADHIPMVFPGEYYSGFRMRPEQTEDYVNTVLRLKDQYKDDIDIHLGFEAEYYPACFEATLDLLRDYPVEYLLLGQHFLGNEEGEDYSGVATTSEQTLARYVSQVIEAMETGKFLYLAHPDLIHYTGPKEIYRKYMRSILQAGNRLGIPMEYNFLGYMERRHYPNKDFWELAGEEGCRVIFGCDAHHAKNTWIPEAEAAGREVVQQYGLKLEEELNLGGDVWQF